MNWTGETFIPMLSLIQGGFQRTSLAKDLGSHRKQFNMTFIAANSALTCENLPDLSGKTIVCVDWTKDFFLKALIGMWYLLTRRFCQLIEGIQP